LQAQYGLLICVVVLTVRRMDAIEGVRRMKMTKHCSKCKETKDVEDFYKRPDSPDGYRAICKECFKSYHYENKEAIKIRRRKRYLKHKEEENYINQQWKLKNRDKCNTYNAKHRAIKLKATPKWADTEAIKRMYIISQFLTDNLGEPHHVDHVVPLQGEKVCGLHVEYNLDVIPAKDNLMKSNKWRCNFA